MVENEDAQTTSDEEQFSTLEYAYKDAKRELDKLKTWSGVDLKETELKIKQQIKARDLAVELLEPIVEAMREALATVNEKYKEN